MAEISMVAALRLWADQDPRRSALTVDQDTLSRADLRARANQRARFLSGLGIGEGDLVTIGLPNSHEFVEYALAALALGATPQPVSHRLPPRELEEIIDVAKSAVVIGAHHGTVTCVESGTSIPDGTSDEDLPDVVAASWKAPTSGGSTGRPKVILSGSPATVDLDAAPPFNLPRDGVVVLPGPLYHNAPFSTTMLSLCHGAHVVLQTKFDACRTLAQVERHRAAFLYLVPTMMHRIWRLDQAERNCYDLSSLEVVYHMAAPCPPWLKDAWIEWLGAERIFELYGGTEQQALTTITGPEWLEHRGSVGRVTTGEMRVLGDDGRDLPAGEVGEIYMRPASGSSPTYRYLGAKAKTVEGWDSLGDMGWFDADGYLYLADRRKDLIISGGANVYPAEVEAALQEHPAVASCAVIGLPDDDLGERVHAVVQRASDITADELLEALNSRLVRYKHPRSIEFVEESLRDDAGKVRRSALREQRVRSMQPTEHP